MQACKSLFHFIYQFFFKESDVYIVIIECQWNKIKIDINSIIWWCIIIHSYIFNIGFLWYCKYYECFSTILNINTFTIWYGDDRLLFFSFFFFSKLLRFVERWVYIFCLYLSILKSLPYINITCFYLSISESLAYISYIPLYIRIIGLYCLLIPLYQNHFLIPLCIRSIALYFLLIPLYIRITDSYCLIMPLYIQSIGCFLLIPLYIRSKLH